ncbi:unnamed protein product [Bemisia tabaci]|uniref:Uncharacterized protein n=1 Tax=Bemisia tabaci TaxID=7038 RepID=A0A9P0AEH3_BEMTA|nr:unnamed protein product [Bemisia tabaci]
MGIALDDEELNSLFESNPNTFQPTSKTNPIPKRPLSYYNELYDCLSNLKDKTLENRSHSLDESTFAPNAINYSHHSQNDESIDRANSVESIEPQLLDEIGLTVQKLIAQCHELSKNKQLERRNSLRVGKVADRQNADQMIYEIDLSRFCNQTSPDHCKTNMNLVVSPDRGKVTTPQVKELVISFSGSKSSCNDLKNSKPNDGNIVDENLLGNETDFYYSIDDINSALDADSEVKSSFDSCLKDQNIELDKSLEPIVRHPKAFDETLLASGNRHAGSFERDVLFSSDIEDKYQADVSSSEDCPRLIINVELNLDDNQSSDVTTESSELSSSASTKSGSYLLTESETYFGNQILEKKGSIAKGEVNSESPTSNLNASDDAVSIHSDFQLFDRRKKVPSNCSTDSITKNGSLQCADKSVLKFKFAPLENRLADSISDIESSTGCINSNASDGPVYAEENEFSNTESTGFSFYSENRLSNFGISKSSICSEDLSVFSNRSTSYGICSEDSVAPNSVDSSEPVSQSENNAEYSADNFSEDNTVLIESESEVSISSDIIAWQRDIFLSVLDDSDEDWVIHDRAEEDSRDGSSGNIYSGSSSPLAEVDESPTTSSVELLSVPTGWSAHIDKDTGLPCYVNAVTGARPEKMSLYGMYKKRCPKRMGIALDDEELNSLFESNPNTYQPTSKTNPIPKRPLSYYNELYDCLSNLKDKTLENRSHSLDESTFAPNAINYSHHSQNDESIDRANSVESIEPQLLDEIGLTVQKLIAQCHELSKNKQLERRNSLRVGKVADRQNADQMIYEIDLSRFCNQTSPDHCKTNMNLVVSPDRGKVTTPQVKELVISFSGSKSSCNDLKNSKPNDGNIVDENLLGNETDFYYSIDDINSALDADSEVKSSFDSCLKDQNIELDKSLEPIVRHPKAFDETLLASGNRHAGSFERDVLFSSDIEDKYQADVSSSEDCPRLIINVELNLDDNQSSDVTTESSELSSSASTKSGSYLLTESETYFGNQILEKKGSIAKGEVNSESPTSNLNASDDAVSIHSDFQLFDRRKKVPSNCSTDSITKNGSLQCADKSVLKFKFAPLENRLADSISDIESSTGCINSNASDGPVYAEENEFSNTESTGFSFYSENRLSNFGISKSSICSEDLSVFSNRSTSYGICSEDSVAPNSVDSSEPVSQSENNAEYSADNFSEDNTVLIESESEVSISSDIIAWQRDIFLSVLDDSDEDWVIHDRAESTGNEKESTQDQSPAHEPPVKSGKVDGAPEEKNLSRSIKSRSMILLDSKLEELTPMSRNWPQLWNGHMCILQEGSLNRTKITENGKRLRKNWASAYVVLTELFLLFFKDAKSFAAMKNGGWKPELCVDLNGALIDRGDKVSSRKNVFIISTVLGLQVLIQCDCTATASSWLNAIQSAIKNLPSGFDNCSRLIRNSTSPECNSPEGGKKAKIGRSKSVKLKNKDGSIEDLTISVAERQTKIRARLKKFFHRRPTMESLVKKGIWKDEPVFGCFLEQVCSGESPRVPLVVQRCIKCIESSEENMKADGLYRASGNLSQVQKIRLQVDQNNLAVLDQEEDVHVLTGALKLFFRELKEPLIPCHLFNKALKASSKVTKYKEFNRMHIPNLAIVFGPTLMWPAQESANMALDLMQQNLVIECFLVEFEQIFR